VTRFRVAPAPLPDHVPWDLDTLADATARYWHRVVIGDREPSFTGLLHPPKRGHLAAAVRASNVPPARNRR
jgi:hypothetical protein